RKLNFPGCGDIQRRQQPNQLGHSPSSSIEKYSGTSCLECGRLLYLDQFQCLAAWAFDHHGTRLPKFVRLFEELDALFAQLRDPGVEVADAEGNMIRQVSAGANERLIPLTLIPIQRHVIEEDTR